MGGQEKLEFQGVEGLRVEGRFDGGKLSTDGGLLLVRDVAEGHRFFSRLEGCFIDNRKQDAVTHTVGHLVRQRVYGLIAGYEDLNDHDVLRRDPVAQLVAGRVPGTAPLAGHSTLGRLELSARTISATERDKKVAIDDERMQAFLITEFVRYAKRRKLREVVLDIDATDIPLHGHQEGRFFHGYYGHYCYLPLYIFCDEFPLWAELRPAGIDAAHGTVEALTKIVPALRAATSGCIVGVGTLKIASRSSSNSLQAEPAHPSNGQTRSGFGSPPLRIYSSCWCESTGSKGPHSRKQRCTRSVLVSSSVLFRFPLPSGGCTSRFPNAFRFSPSSSARSKT